MSTRHCAILAIVLGVLTTLGIAFVGAAVTRHPWGMTRGFSERAIGPSDPKRPLLLELHTEDNWVATFAYGRVRMSEMVFSGKQQTPEMIAQRWQHSRVIPWASGSAALPDTDEWARITAKAAGWPWRCVWCKVAVNNIRDAAGNYTHVYRAPGGIVLPATYKPGAADWPPDYPPIIPLRPIVPEMLGNVAVFAGAWWVLLLGPRGVIRWRRRRRGLCIKCGYDLRATPADSPCPECGKPGRGRVAADLPS